MGNRYPMAVVLAAAVLAVVSGCTLLPEPALEDGGVNGDIPSPGNGDGAGGAKPEPDPGSTEPCLPSPDPEPAPYPGGGPLAFFGKTMEQIRAELGEPGEQGSYAGSEYYAYDREGIYFFFWAVPGGETMVRGITLLEGNDVTGVQVGSTFTRIKDVLGEPVFEGYSDYEGSYSLIYDYDRFRLFFYADSPGGPTTHVLIKYADEC